METAAIIETYDAQGRYTGHYRLIGVPGGSIDLPGRGGKRTKEAAARAIAAFEAGKTNTEATQAAWERD